MTHYSRTARVIATAALLLPMIAAGVESEDQAAAMERCLLENTVGADPDTTVGELRVACEAELGRADAHAPEPLTPAQERMLNEQMNYDRSFAISPFQPNYFLASYMAEPNDEPFDDQDVLDNGEAKFQVSIKAPLWRSMFSSNNDLMAAFTSLSWWQIGNADFSRPFRETNYQPELFVRHYGGPHFLSGRLAAFDIGFNHQSNGRTEQLSRSWNRIMGRVFFDFDDFAMQLRAWYRLPEDEEEDDNPGMYRYYGYGDLRIAYAPNRNSFTMLLRPGTEKGAVELTWSYPLSDLIRVYAQYWNGYGESLLDYDVQMERIGIGFALNDFLQRR